MNTIPSNVVIRQYLVDPLPPAVAEAIARLATAPDVERIVILPDVHLAEDVCVGTVLATRRLLYPAAVGGDIGCGMTAVRLGANAELLAHETAAAQLLAGLYARVPVLRHGTATMPASLPAALVAAPLSDLRLEKEKQRDGRVQFGTLGRGNHFLEVQADAQDQLWLMVHSGSRAMGQSITQHHLARATPGASGLKFLPADTEAGQAYLTDVGWAVAYAEQNRRRMVQATGEVLADAFQVEVDWASLIDSHHNHVRHEVHCGEGYWVHRKGALPAFAGAAGVVPGSMGTASFHVVGRGCAEALCSSAHGAGRALSRVAAQRRVSVRDLHRQMNGVWFDHRRATALREEAPAAYKDIRAVLRAQRELTKITRELRPLLVYKG